ncbi:MotA/TolQ/ExbB proton channel family protein [Catenovulum sp. 2E275]|uniref:MotA/TolQ/ExbB proton channel family protein n=1 Tax=Catenovulum sp. 2E275 TaxID=2980497 RepID=UPI0021D3378E|nr:MotA/TolQ/ExbB proton channel family protein [Catenovulum sp. 2E275]MCU4676530.1 MotA/TolQ/ExbB proton channel family protein [Catenovulum sp. 2E275]
MIEQMISNWLCWVMLVVAWFAYQQIFLLYVQKNEQELIGADDQTISGKQMLPNVLVGALPLMGLLGTIAGLQDSFVGMMTAGVDSQIVSGGIADALLTTQLGLVLAIPGWLSLVFVNAAIKKAQVGGKISHA